MKKVFLFLFLVASQLVFSQTKKDYIYKYASVAVAEMEYAKIPASITLAQGILESRFGLSELSVNANNHFGIKCHNNWQGGRTYHDDDAKNECFRAYENAWRSFRDHSNFLTDGNRYNDLFKLSIFDYKGWAKGLRKAGYATNPRYAKHLIKIIEDEKLYVFDRMTTEEVGPYIASLQSNQKEGETMWAKAEPTPKKVDKPEPINTVTQKDQTIEIIGGPAASPEDEISQSRDIFIVNDIKTVHSFEGDTKAYIAASYNIPLGRLEKYNEWDRYYDEFLPGMKIYLQPKRSKSRDVSKLTHIVQPGETMYQIAQQYGIKTDKLYKRNLLNQAIEEQPHPGEIINLRKNRDSKPKLLDPDEVFTAQKMQVVHDGQGDAIGRPNQSEEETEAFIENEIIKDKPTETPEPKTETKVIKTAPVVVETKQPAPSKTEYKEEIITSDPFSNSEYPSSAPAKQQKEESTVLNPGSDVAKENEQVEGRAIIYEPTPQINREPVKVYEPSTTTTDNRPDENNHVQDSQITYHTVSKGDTLWSLSKQYNVTVEQLKSWNKIESTNINLGQRLIVGR